ncbi:MAG: carboxyltransferase domain-containing protein [Pseudomonadota bacterium]
MSEFPSIDIVGLSGVIVTFAGAMSDQANRAALSFRSAVDAENWPDVQETTMSLVSVFVLADLVEIDAEALRDKLADLLSRQDWYAAALPAGRRLWRIPTVYGGDNAPQLKEAADAAGVTERQAIDEISSSRVRVITIGFAPGQPYLGELPAHWDIPRQQALSKSVPAGALVVAIRQLVLFTGPTPTGWRHIGQTAFENFRQESENPFALNPGDELLFPAVSAADLDDIRARDTSGNGGAESNVLS